MNLLERKLKKNFISFLEKRATEEEIEISESLRQFVSAYNNRNIDAFLSLFADNAIIESKSRGGSPRLMNKKQFGISTLKAFSLVDKLFLDDIVIRVQSSTEVNTNMVMVVLLKNGRIENNRFSLKFKKQNKTWMIIKNIYC